ncbi:carbonic anhydrase [Campylobacter sp. MIT 99-7217]|uniref:DUF2920 family protein n=1 Tax=Campylobacter sp. MIT 99-7217 TaxID=535091 RepID=UPI00115A9F91|nr:DUF2920 family protein [Campylobacter sp. MIT 99-7217]TQR33830.1 carbonic anhydrase [Campylobacter sp. MIT 99-7217]
MLVNKSFEIQSCDDIELKLKRKNLLEYRISYDKSKDLKAIVFIVPGFGDNQNISFLDFDREFLAKNYSVMAVSVFHHCFANRPGINKEEKYNAQILPTQKGLDELNRLLASFGGGAFKRELNAQEFKSLCFYIDELISKASYNGDKIGIECDLIPANDEYQNYGIMQAIDHINALKDIIKHFPSLHKLPRIYAGASHGAYVSMLVAKIAPYFADGVIENSGPTLPYLPFILGRELSQCDFYVNSFKNLLLLCTTKSLWTRNENSPFFFDEAHYLIRTLLNPAHLQSQQRTNNKTIFTHYHSLQDKGASAEHKISFHKLLKELGFDSTLHLIKDESELDGRFIKSLEHGLRLSNKNLLKKELPPLLKKLENKDFKSTNNEFELLHSCKDKNYIFQNNKDGFRLRIL